MPSFCEDAKVLCTFSNNFFKLSLENKAYGVSAAHTALLLWLLPHPVYGSLHRFRLNGFPKKHESCLDVNTAENCKIVTKILETPSATYTDIALVSKAWFCFLTKWNPQRSIQIVLSANTENVLSTNVYSIPAFTVGDRKLIHSLDPHNQTAKHRKLLGSPS